MTKKKWIIIGSIILAVVLVVVGVLVFKDDIFEPEKNEKTVRVTIERQSLDPTMSTTVDKLGSVRTSQVSGYYTVGSSPRFEFTPTQIGCIYSVRVNGKEVYGYLEGKEVDITKTFEYTLKDIQKETSIVVTFDKRGDASKLNNIVDCTTLLQIKNEGNSNAEVLLHPMLMSNNYANNLNGNSLMSILSGKGYEVNSANQLVCGKVKLASGGTVYPEHGRVKIKLEALEGFELIAFSWPGTTKIEANEDTGSFLGLTINSENKLSGNNIVNVLGNDIAKTTLYSEGSKYSAENPLAEYNSQDQTISINNYSDFIDNKTIFQLFFLPEKIELVDHNTASNIDESSSKNLRLFEVYSNYQSTIGYATVGGDGNINLGEAKSDKLVYVSLTTEGGTTVYELTDSYDGTQKVVLLTKDLIFNGKITFLLTEYENG